MDKHRTNVFITLVLVLLIIAAILAWTTGSSILKGADPQSTEQSAGTQQQPSGGKNSEEAAPSRMVDESGTISSDNPDSLNLRIDWHITSASDTELTLDLQVFVSSYAISTGPHSGAVRICGEEYTFLSQEIIADDGNNAVETMIFETSVTVPAEVGETVAIPIAASWNFEDSYGGRQIDRLSAEQTLTVQG